MAIVLQSNGLDGMGVGVSRRRERAGGALSSIRTTAGVWLGLITSMGIVAASCDGEVPIGHRFSQPVTVGRPAEDVSRAHVSLILERDARHFTVAEREALSRVIVHEALHEDIDPLLVLALMEVESSFRTDAVSAHGAVGLMQLQPATARWVAQRLGRDAPDDAALSEPLTNVRLGVRYFAHLHRRFKSFALSLEAYNRGPNHPELWDKGLEDNPLGDRFWQRVLLRYRDYREAVDSAAHASASDPSWRIGLGDAELKAFLTADPLEPPLL